MGILEKKGSGDEGILGIISFYNDDYESG